MKYRGGLGLLAVLFLWSGTAAAMPAKPRIKADMTYYNFDKGIYVLNGNVTSWRTGERTDYLNAG